MRTTKQDLRGTELLHAGIDGRLHILCKRDIALDRKGCCPEAGGHGLGTHQVQVSNQHARALFNEQAGNAFPKTCTAARHDGNFVEQISHAHPFKAKASGARPK
jgi:hypothetical protein